MSTAISARQELLATCCMPTRQSRAYRKPNGASSSQPLLPAINLLCERFYDRTHRLVFTLTLRILGNPASAEEVTLDVFHDIWRRASGYDGTGGSVLGWIMNQARSRAIDRLRFDGRKKRTHSIVADPQMPATTTEVAAAGSEEAHVLQQALQVLTPDERHAIEAAYFSELTYVEVAARLNEPLGTIKTRIRSALGKLRRALTTGATTG